MESSIMAGSWIVFGTLLVVIPKRLILLERRLWHGGESSSHSRINRPIGRWEIMITVFLGLIGIIGGVLFLLQIHVGLL